jgi:hypothetical protein
VASVAEVAAWSRVSSLRLSTSHAELECMDTTPLAAAARDIRAQNDCGRPRDWRTEHEFGGLKLPQCRLLGPLPTAVLFGPLG